jgi:threonine 3-dehydrogenase
MERTGPHIMTNKTMKALVYDRRLDPWESSKGLRQVEVPAPTLDEAKDPRDADMALVRVRYAGFCGSDRGIWFRKSFRDDILNTIAAEGGERRIIGHEFFGDVLAVGTRAQREIGLLPGDTVSAESHVICGVCYQCRSGDNHVCADNKIIGISQDGCFAEYVKLPAKILWRTDTNRIRPEVAAVQEPFGNAVHSCTRVNLRGKTVAIIGCGTIGLFSVAIAKALGARKVIGVEPMPSHIEMAKKLGADEVLVPRSVGYDVVEHDPALAQKVRDLTEGVGVDVAIEMTGINASVNNAIHLVRRGGDVVLFGLKDGNQVIEEMSKVIMNGISFHSVCGRRIWENWYVTRSLLENKDTGIHDKVWNVILKGGDNTIVDFDKFEPVSFEERIKTHPKVLFRFA